MINDKFVINEFEERKTTKGVPFWRFGTDKGWLSCFDIKLKEILLKEMDKPEGIYLMVDNNSQGFMNVKGLSSIEIPKKENNVLSSLPPVLSNMNSIYTSYAKDLFIALLNRLETHEKINYDDLMKRSVELVQFARTSFSEK